MFDLFRSRQKAVRILLGVLLAMVALSMLVYLIPGAGAPMGNKDDQILAEIGKEVVTVHQVEQQIRNVLQNRQVSPDVVQAIIPGLVEQAISDRALAYEAKQLGFEITDRELANTIRSLGQVGTMLPQQYRMFIEQMGMSVPEFEDNVRTQTYQEALQNIVLEATIVSPAEVEAEYRQRNDKAKLEYIAFDPGKLGLELKPAAQELKDYFEKNKTLFAVPESRSVQLIVADQAKVAESIALSDTQIQGYYNSHKDQYRTPERVKARHILVMTLNKQGDEIPKLKAKAEDLLKQIKAGADFAKLAEKNSDDTTSATKGGDLGWVVRGQMTKAFEDATFALKPNEISNIITTEYGFHIIQVLEKEQPRLRPLDEVKTGIVTTLKNQVVFDRMQALADQARAELVKAPQKAQQVAGQLGLLYVNADKYKQGDTIPELGADPQVVATIASLQKGEVSQVLQSGQKLAIIVVTAIYPSHHGDFAEVESQVLARYQQEKGVQLVKEKSNKAADIAKTNGGDLKAAAKSVGLEVKTTDWFNRNGAAEGIGSANYLGDSFDKPVGTLIGPLDVGTQTVLGKIVDKQSADMSKLDAERDTIVLQLKGKKSRERAELLRDSVLNYLADKGKVKIHKDVKDRLLNRYRG